MENKKISPLKKDSLRYAGQSLDEKINDVLYDKILIPMIGIAFLILFTFFEWASVYFKYQYALSVYITVTLGFIIYYSFKIKPAIKYIRDLQLGRDGERAVSESLEELRISGYKVYNDFVCESFNIDHIIVGPAGIFTIETKTYRKQVGTNPQISYDGLKILVNGISYPKDPIRQAKGQMYWLEGFIKDNAKIAVKVKPVVIFPGWYVNPINNTVEVWVLNEKALPAFLKNSPVLLNNEQINLIASHIESYNRNA